MDESIVSESPVNQSDPVDAGEGKSDEAVAKDDSLNTAEKIEGEGPDGM